MDARFLQYIGRTLMLLVLFSVIAIAAETTMGAVYETNNFITDAPHAELARQCGEAAEQYRQELATLWLGKTLPDWSVKCPVKIHAAEDLGAGGMTSFVFENGNVFGWKMEIQGSPQRILDSVLPHEITHMIFASHFRKPVPRWIDEGAATMMEHWSEKENYRQKLHRFLRDDVRKGIPLNRIVALKDYPADPIPFYAQGFSLVEYLLEKGRQTDSQEHQRLVRFTEKAMQSGQWQTALQEHYGIDNLGSLQTAWLHWVGKGEDGKRGMNHDAVSPHQPAYGKPVYGKSVYERTTAARVIQ